MAGIQLPGLNALVDQFNATGKFEILAVRCNQFGLQDWPSDAELLPVLKHVRPGGGFVPKYKYASKLEVNGENEHALFTFLKSSCAATVNRIGAKGMMFWDPIYQSDLTWNFEKFLVDKTGKPRFRHHPRQLPSALATQIQQLINENVTNVAKSDSGAVKKSHKAVRKIPSLKSLKIAQSIMKKQPLVDKADKKN